MTKHSTSFEDGAVDIARYFEKRPYGTAGDPGTGGAMGHDLLSEIIERQILPRLLETKREPVNDWEAAAYPGQDAGAISAFVEMIIDDDVEQLRAVADRVILHTGSRDALLSELLTPAARLLGRMWEDDACDFMTVTLGVYRLNQIMRESEAAAAEVPAAHAFDHRILLLPAPGEQHSAGLTLVADAFRAAGWCVRSTPEISRAQLIRLVKDEWLDGVGLSVPTEQCFKGLPSCIRAVRAASCNPKMFVMIGGDAITCDPDRLRFLGADIVAENAGKAVRQANSFMETTVTDRVCQFNTTPSDVGLAL